MDLHTQVGSLVLESPVMNGAGWAKDRTHVNDLARSASAAIVVGSITVLPRTGNSGNVFEFLCNNEGTPNGSALNSLGIPNPGKEYYERNLSNFAHVAGVENKPLIVSVAGFSLEEYIELAVLAAHSGASMVEFNFGCPNIWHGTAQHRIVSFNPELIARILGATKKVVSQRATIAVKLSPYSDPFLLAEVASVVAESGCVSAVVTMNTFPNAFAWKARGKRLITPASGRAGLSGAGIKPIALGQVEQFRSLLPSEISIIGVGGVRSGQDVIEFLDAGANAVQVVTALMNEAPGVVFSRILTEYTELLEGTALWV